MVNPARHGDGFVAACYVASFTVLLAFGAGAVYLTIKNNKAATGSTTVGGASKHGRLNPSSRSRKERRVHPRGVVICQRRRTYMEIYSIGRYRC
jgi:hypothetical protein